MLGIQFSASSLAGVCDKKERQKEKATKGK
jgi:hypothetical protein